VPPLWVGGAPAIPVGGPCFPASWWGRGTSVRRRVDRRRRRSGCDLDCDVAWSAASVHA